MPNYRKPISPQFEVPNDTYEEILDAARIFLSPHTVDYLPQLEQVSRGLKELRTEGLTGAADEFFTAYLTYRLWGNNEKIENRGTLKELAEAEKAMARHVPGVRGAWIMEAIVALVDEELDKRFPEQALPRIPGRR
jgi:hypothetical protein